MQRDPAPTEGQQVMAWVALLHAFGTVEIIERTNDLDIGPNGKGHFQQTWLAVCVDPFWKPYRGSLVVVRQFKTGTVFVLAVDNDDVLYGDEGKDPIVRAAAPVRFVFQLTSVLGGAFIETDGDGVITRATGEYGDYYIGMAFRAFMAGIQKADPRVRYVRLWGDWDTSTRLSL